MLQDIKDSKRINGSLAEASTSPRELLQLCTTSSRTENRDSRDLRVGLLRQRSAAQGHRWTPGHLRQHIGGGMLNEA